MKKISIIFLIALLSVFTISNYAFAQTEISVWNVSAIESDPGVLAIAEIYEEENPDVTINFTGIPYSDKLTKSTTEFFTAGEYTSFDVDEINEMWLPEFVENDWLAPIDEYVDRDFLEGYPDDVINSLTYDGSVFAIPHYINMPLFFYNEEMLAEAGYDRPPKDWDELMEYAANLTKEGQFGFAAPLYQESDTVYFISTYFYQAGVRIYDEDKNIAFNTSEAVETYKFLGDMYKAEYMPAGCTSMDCFEVANLFRQEKVAMMINWAFEIQTCLGEESKVRDKFAVSSHPAGGAGQKLCAAPWLYVLSNKAEEKELAAEYLRMFMDPEILVNFVKLEPGKIIPVAGLYDQQEVQESMPFSEVITENIDNFVLEVGPKKEEVAIILAEELNKVLIGEKTAEEAINDAEQRANDTL